MPFVIPFDRVPLRPHPQTPAGPVQAIEVALAADGDRIALRFRITGEISRLRIPAARAPARVDGLWRHTCFELFVACDGSPAYEEFNFSPSGEWAAYAFSGYREPAGDGHDALPEGMHPATASAASADRFELRVALPTPVLAADTPNDLRLALTAVIEDTDGVLSYWALHHPRPQPDFHHPDGFVHVAEFGETGRASPRREG